MVWLNIMYSETVKAIARGSTEAWEGYERACTFGTYYQPSPSETSVDVLRTSMLRS